MLIQTKYHNVREDIQEGDIIAFGGKGGIPSLIKLFTRSNVSHVALIMKAKTNQEGILNLMIESTTLEGYSGVVVNRLSNRLKDYKGDAWWLPLSKESRERADWEGSYDWLKRQKRKAYDSLQALGSGLDLIMNNKEDFDRLFCSELISAFYEHVRIIEAINSSEVTPIDLCMFNLYEHNYYQLCGQVKDIRGYNSVEAGNWVL